MVRRRELFYVGAIVAALASVSIGLRADELEEEFRRHQAIEQQLAEVNGGELEFLPEPPAGPVHHHQNRLVLSHESLRDGWVQLRQCHDDIDPVSAAEILFHPDRVRELALESRANIGEARVEGNRIILRDVGPGAHLCISARSQALHEEAKGHYVLRNGPYMRRFLDGFYPLHLSMEVHWPAEQLQLMAVSPSEQPGLAMEQQPGRLGLDTWFRGKLITELHFFSTP